MIVPICSKTLLTFSCKKFVNLKMEFKDQKDLLTISLERLEKFNYVISNFKPAVSDSAVFLYVSRTTQQQSQNINLLTVIIQPLLTLINLLRGAFCCSLQLQRKLDNRISLSSNSVSRDIHGSNLYFSTQKMKLYLLS